MMDRVIVSPGQRYGRLLVVRELEPVFASFRTARFVEAACDCGNIVSVKLNNLRTGNTSSCGCFRIERCREEFCLPVPPGSIFGMLTVTREIPVSERGKSYRIIECICSCGNLTTATLGNLVKGKTGSCGCFMKYFRESGNARRTHGKSGSLEWNTWLQMMTRCLSPYAVNFKRYGGRGITVCERWKNPSNFLSDVISSIGYRPGIQYSLDRKDNSKGYDPGNIKWSTDKEQARNTRRNVWIDYQGERRLLIEVCEELNLPYRRALLRKRRYGYPDEDLFKPLRVRH